MSLSYCTQCDLLLSRRSDTAAGRPILGSVESNHQNEHGCGLTDANVFPLI